MASVVASDLWPLDLLLMLLILMMLQLQLRLHVNCYLICALPLVLQNQMEVASSLDFVLIRPVRGTFCNLNRLLCADAAEEWN